MKYQLFLSSCLCFFFLFPFSATASDNSRAPRYPYPQAERLIPSQTLHAPTPRPKLRQKSRKLGFFKRIMANRLVKKIERKLAQYEAGAAAPGKRTLSLISFLAALGGILFLAIQVSIFPVIGVLALVGSVVIGFASFGPEGINGFNLAGIIIGGGFLLLILLAIVLLGALLLSQ